MAITVDDLTTTVLDGTGIFDVLMRANKAHLEAEFNKNRIKGSEYATVYLGSLEAVMTASMTFLLQRDKNNKEVEILAAQLALLTQQALNATIEATVLTAQKLKLDAEIALLKQKTITEAAQIALLDKQKELYDAQANGFKRDAEQKAAKIMVDTWNVRRTTNDATGVNNENNLTDHHIGEAVAKLLTGIGSTNFS